MKIINWIRNFLEKDKSEIYTTDTAIRQKARLEMEDFAILSAINLIAGCISKCEFRTFWDGKEIQGAEYYTWNIEPNRNQNSSQFWNEVVSKLLYYNECLVVEIGGQLIIADDYSITENAVTESYFTNVSRGTITFRKTFMMSEVLYFKNYDTDIRRLLSSLFAGYNDLISRAVDKYNKSGGRKGILKVDSTAFGNEEAKKRYEDLMNNRFKTYFNAENAVLPLFNGYEYTEQSKEESNRYSSEISNIATITKEAFQKVAQAFKIPLPLLLGDIADVEKVTDNFLTFCIDPLADLITEEIVRKRYGQEEFAKGRLLDVDTTSIKHIDLFSIANSFDKLVACGGYSIDELRRKARDSEIGEEWSQRHWMTKNYQHIEMTEAEGGES